MNKECPKRKSLSLHIEDYATALQGSSKQLGFFLGWAFAIIITANTLFWLYTGHETVGVVVSAHINCSEGKTNPTTQAAIGPDVKGFKVGERVVAE